MSVAKKNMSKQLPQKLLGAVVEFMARAGVSESAARAAFSAALVKSRPLRTASRDDMLERFRPHGDVSAHLLRLWHRDAKYIDSQDCKPRPLPLLTGNNSLRALIKKLDPSANAMQILREMKEAKLIQRNAKGRYIPTTNAAVIPKLHPWAVEHAAHSLLRLISTVYRNSNAASDSPPLLERYTYVPDLNPDDAQAFAGFARSQGQLLLDTLDDWLEQRRVRKSPQSRSRGRGGIPAGVHLITFVGDEAAMPATPGVPQPGRMKAPKTLRKRGSEASARLTPLPATPS